MPMSTLSRREEDTLLKAAKARALHECDDIVKEFAKCAEGRTVTVTYACKDKFADVQQCMLQYTGPEAMDTIRAEYLRLRDAKVSQMAAASS